MPSPFSLSELLWARHSRVRKAYPRLGFFLSDEFKTQIAVAKEYGVHLIPEIHSGVRVTLPFMHHIYKRFCRYWDIASKQHEMDYKRRAQGVGACCSDGFPSLLTLPLYLRAIQDVCKPGEEAISYQPLWEVERGELHQVVRRYKRHDSRFDSYAFSCRYCSPSKRLLLSPQIQTYIALICWYSELERQWVALQRAIFERAGYIQIPGSDTQTALALGQDLLERGLWSCGSVVS